MAKDTSPGPSSDHSHHNDDGGFAKRPPASTEFFSWVDGQMSDAEMHDDILDNPDADASTRSDTVRYVVSSGTMTFDEALGLYGDDLEHLRSELAPHAGRTATSFVTDQRQHQGAFLARHHPEYAGYRGASYRLPPEHVRLNLAPSIRENAQVYFKEKGITWHIHASHALWSQICCLNFLMPLAQQPDALARLVGHALRIEPPTMLPMETDAAGTPWYVAFEWIGERDYLNEAKPGANRTRGANVTSADAAVKFLYRGRVEILLIEWKYTESYGTPLGPAGNATRVARYKDITFAPAGPVLADTGLKLEDFFWEPLYQLLRQQMLAHQMQEHGEADAHRVRVLHISPSGNQALHKVTAPELRRFGSDAFAAFKSVLTHPEALVGYTIEALFRPLLVDEDPDTRVWADYLHERYAFLGRQPSQPSQPSTAETI